MSPVTCHEGAVITGQVPHLLMTDHWLSCSLHVYSWCSLLTRGQVVVVPEVPGVVVSLEAPVGLVVAVTRLVIVSS